MAKLTDKTLEELYATPKKTPAVEKAILLKADFSSINRDYCNNICRLKCKQPERVDFSSSKADILIIQDHREPRGKFDKFEGQQERSKKAVLDFILNRAGAEGVSVKFTSLLKCPASEKDFPNEKPPTPLVMRKCSPYLYEEIKAAKPKVIVTLGTASTKALGLTTKSNTGNRGEVAFTTMFGEPIPVIMTLHPRILTFIRQNARGSGGMWGPDYMSIIQNDLSKAVRIAKGEVKYTPDTLKNAVKALLETGRLKIARSDEQAAEFMREVNALPPTKIVSFDTETTSLDVMSPDLKILTIQFGWRDDQGNLHARVIPLWHRNNVWVNPDKIWPAIAGWLGSDRPKLAHNGKYDILVIYFAKGIRVKNFRLDTLLLLHSINSGVQGTYGLKVATWDHMFESGLGGYEDQLGDLKKIKKPEEQTEEEEGDSE